MHLLKNSPRMALLTGITLLAVSGFSIMTVHAHGHGGGHGGGGVHGRADQIEALGLAAAFVRGLSHGGQQEALALEPFERDVHGAASHVAFRTRL